MNSISLATSPSRRALPRELSSSTRTLQPVRSKAFTGLEPIKPLPPVTRIRALLMRAGPYRRPRPQDRSRPLLVRAAGGVYELLHTIAFGKSGRGRAAAFDGVKERLTSLDTGAMRPSGYCASTGSLTVMRSSADTGRLA